MWGELQRGEILAFKRDPGDGFICRHEPCSNCPSLNPWLVARKQITAGQRRLLRIATFLIPSIPKPYTYTPEAEVRTPSLRVEGSLQVMTPTHPSPFTWTMRFKHGKKTVVLHVDPLSPFADIKIELLRSLHLTHPNGLLTPRLRIPDRHEDVLLARPVDRDDYTRGWTRLRTDAAEVEEDGDAALKEIQADEDSKKPGKGKSKRQDIPDVSPKATGLKDGCELAFRFRSEVLQNVGEEQGTEGEAWYVVQLTYDDVVAPQMDEDEGLGPDLGA